MASVQQFLATPQCVMPVEIDLCQTDIVLLIASTRNVSCTFQIEDLMLTSIPLASVKTQTEAIICTTAQMENLFYLAAWHGMFPDGYVNCFRNGFVPNIFFTWGCSERRKEGLLLCQQLKGPSSLSFADNELLSKRKINARPVRKPPLYCKHCY